MEHPLQTKEWGEFRKEWGNEVEFINNNLIVFSKIPHTKFTIGTCLKGPDIAGSDPAIFKNVGKNHNAIFIKFEPNVVAGSKQYVEWKNAIKKSGLQFTQGKT